MSSSSSIKPTRVPPKPRPGSARKDSGITDDSPPSSKKPNAAGWIRTLSRGLGGAYTLVIAIGLASFCSRQADFRSEPHPAPSFPVTQPGHAVDVATFEHGATVRASSYAARHHHLPTFAIDGERFPMVPEKWASYSDDRAPWIEVHLRHRADVYMIGLQLAGTVEKHDLSMRDYTIYCGRFEEKPAGEDPLPVVVGTLSIEGNQAPFPRHWVDCLGVDWIKVSFELAPPGEPRSTVILYELEAWGVVR